MAGLFKTCLTAGILASALAAMPAQAQKSKDTLRVAFSSPISTVVEWLDPQPETGVTSNAVFDTLMCYDHRSLVFKPLLASSWQQVDDRTLVFQLRDDVKFHDGSPVVAGDVVASLDWMRDPGNKLRFASEVFSWIDKVEAVDDHTVRIVAKEPTAQAMIRLAVSAPILPGKLLNSYQDKSEFGRKTPVGTGPYKAVSVDPNSGVTLVRNDDYRHGGDCKPAGKIPRIQAVPIPDSQTQIAQMTVGGIDLIHGVSKDEAELLSSNPQVKVTASQGLSFFYLTMDSINRSGNAALSNLKVRQAIARAIDREMIGRSVSGGSVHAIDAICLPNQRGCDFSKKPPSYDPAAARQLLTEAGYPDGFDTEITAVPGSATMGEAIAGELRKIGIRAKVDKPTFPGYRQKQRDGKTQMIAGQWTLGGLPDVSATTNFYFDGAARDFWHDKIIDQLAKEGLATLDDGKRKAIYRQLFDRVTEMSYILPITTSPDVFVHTKDLFVDQGSFNDYGADFFEMRWN